MSMMPCRSVHSLTQQHDVFDSMMLCVRKFYLLFLNIQHKSNLDSSRGAIRGKKKNKKKRKSEKMPILSLQLLGSNNFSFQHSIATKKINRQKRGEDEEREKMEYSPRWGRLPIFITFFVFHCSHACIIVTSEKQVLFFSSVLRSR